MALPKVTINITSGLGRVADTADAVCGMVVGGAAASGLAQNVAARVFALSGAEALGITATAHPHAHAQIAAFYGQSGNGAPLWIMLVPDTTLASAIFAANGPMDKLLAAAGGDITVAGYSIKRAAGYAPGADWFDYDAASVAASAQTLAYRYVTDFAPVRIILDGSYLNATKLNAGDAFPAYKGIADRVCIWVGAENAGDRHSAMGRFLGWIAASTVEENVGKVKRQAFLGTGYLTTGANVQSYVTAQIEALHDAGIIALRKFVGVGGVYATNDPTLAASTSDYSKLARGRVIDKAIRLTYQTYVQEINDTIEITPEGKLSPTQVSYLEDRIENTLKLRMTAEGNISSARCVVDPNQDVLATDKIEIEIYIIPLGVLEEIVVKLGFENPAQS